MIFWKEGIFLGAVGRIQHLKERGDLGDGSLPVGPGTEAFCK